MKKNKSGLGEVIAGTLILFVTITAFVAGFNWYQGLTSDYESKQMQSYTTDISESVKLMSFRNESGVYILYFKSSLTGYAVINGISLNGDECQMTNNNVLLKTSISQIVVDCPTFQRVNDIKVITDFGVLNLKKSFD